MDDLLTGYLIVQVDLCGQNGDAFIRIHQRVSASLAQALEKGFGFLFDNSPVVLRLTAQLVKSGQSIKLNNAFHPVYEVKLQESKAIRIRMLIDAETITVYVLKRELYSLRNLLYALELR